MSKQRLWSALVLVLGACSGGGAAPGSVAPANTSARGAVDAFMQAVADSNLARMASIWGTRSGAAADTRQPPDYERRVAVMQTYLRNESHRVLPSSSSGEAQEELQVELRRGLCTWIVPFTAIRLSDGKWLVNQVDLTKAGNPARPCDPGAMEDTTTAQ